MKFKFLMNIMGTEKKRSHDKRSSCTNNANCLLNKIISIL